MTRLFHLGERKTTVSREFRGAIATFLTMAYILFVNPEILANAGVPRDSAVACTAAAAGICCILMGLIGNFPLALASGMGLNAVVAFQITKETGAWQTAMGLVVLDGVVVLILVLCGLREAILYAIPRDLRRAIGAGIGLFIAFIGLVNGKLVVMTGLPQAPLSFGELTTPDATVAAVGLLLTAFLVARRIRGALILGILGATALAFGLGVAKPPGELHWPSFENAFQADVIAAISNIDYIPLLISLVLVDFFDTLGTVTAVADQAGLHEDQLPPPAPPSEGGAGRIPGLRRILLVDAASASVGGLFGASSVTSYIESAAGVAEGARTGLHSIFVGLFFLVAIFAAPFAGIVPGCATAPALVIVGFLMAEQLTKVEFTNPEIGIPAFVTLVTLPLTYSITHGIGYGFISYVAIKVLSLRFREVHWLMYVVTLVFLAYFLRELLGRVI